jgi:hypothetical protein
LDGPAQALLLAVAVAVPGGAPDSVEAPVKPTQDLVAEPVAVAGDLGGVVHESVTLHAKHVYAGMVGVVDADVDPIAGCADLGRDLVAPGPGWSRSPIPRTVTRRPLRLG